MSGDYTRDTFEPSKHYARVLMQQGRVQLDVDFNELQDILHHRDQTEARDVIGHCGAPLLRGGFALSSLDGGRDLRISPGRMYVDGILCELEASPVVASIVTGSPPQLQLETLHLDGYLLEPGHWLELFDPATASSSPPGALALLRVIAVDEDNLLITTDGDFSPFLVSPPLDLRVRRVTTLLTQPDLPNPGVDGLTTSPPAPISSPPGSLNLALGLYLAFLDVWQREVTALEDPRIREVALGGPDTATRLKTISQVRLLSVAATSPAQASCTTAFPEWEERILPSSGRLNARTQAPLTDENPCELPPTAGYRRLENQLYRVQIHDGGARAQATFKWSRDNGSVETRIVEIDPVDGTRVEVSSTGKDEVLGFQPGQWVEIIDEEAELKGEPHPLVQIDEVSPGDNLVTLATDISAHRGIARKLRRWDQSTSVNAEGLIALTAGDAQDWFELEGGIQVRFEEGSYRSGDFWLIPARTITGEIEWPPFEIPNPHPFPQSPHGIHHHYCRLALVEVESDGTLTVHDCRCRFPSLTQTLALYYVSGDGQEAMPAPPFSAGTLAPVPQPLVVGVVNPQCLEIPARVRFTILKGTGRLRAPDGSDVGDELVLNADEHGLVECAWDLGADLSTAPARADNLPSQQVEAWLLDQDGNPLHLPIRFNGNLSLAEQVAYDPGSCPNLGGDNTVQEAIDKLADTITVAYHSGDGQEAPPGQWLPQQVAVRVYRLCGNLPADLQIEFTPESGGGVSDAAPAGAGVPTVTVPLSNGIAGCFWRLDAAINLPSQRLVAKLVDPSGTVPVQGPPFVIFTANQDQTDRGIRVTALRLFDVDLQNDTNVTVEQLARGIRIECDIAVQPLTVRGKPTVFVTLEMPFPFNPSDLQFWGQPVIGFQPVVLGAEVDAASNVINWQPAPTTRDWLLTRLFQAMTQLERGDRVLARLTLHGNFIWSGEDPDLFLDGELFGFMKEPDPTTHHRLPSGEGHRGGDLRMWFWLVGGQVTLPTITVHPGAVTVLVGGLATFGVQATGTAPLTFQWFKNGAAIAGANQSSLTLPAVSLSDNGSVFFVQVSNSAGSVQSEAAVLNVFTIQLAGGQGGTINFVNRGSGFSAPVFRAGGATRVGTGFAAELVVGIDPANLHAVGTPRPFLTGVNAGFWRAETVTLPDVGPGSTLLARVRVWPVNQFPTFEAAEAAGAALGISPVFQLTTGGAGEPPSPPGVLNGMTSFSLSA